MAAVVLIPAAVLLLPAVVLVAVAVLFVLNTRGKRAGPPAGDAVRSIVIGLCM